MRPISLSLTIARDAAAPIFEQIAAKLRARITSGDIPEGQVLPPTRSFSQQLGVSRSSVVTAYDQLVAEGYIIGLRGSGFRVASVGDATLPSHSAPSENLRPIREDISQKPRPFRPGEPDMRLFPHQAWAKTVSRVSRQDPEAMLGQAPRFGLPALRQAIAAHVADWRGLDVDPARIIVTSGASDALEMCLRVLCAAGDRVAIEDPGYRPLRAFIQDQGLTPEFLPVDTQGAVVPDQAGVAVLTPSQHFPLGGSMSPARRHGFLRWAQGRNGWVIEDDYDSEFRFSGHPIPSLASLDHQSRTLYVGSFSKIFSNSLRIGYVVAPESLLERFRTVQRRFGTRASLMPQAPLAAFMQSGEFYRHLRRARRIYGERRGFLIEALKSEFADIGTFTDHHAGMQVALHLRDGIKDTRVVARAADLGLEVEALSAYCAKARGYNGLILGFCAFDEGEMADALAGLRKVFDSFSGPKP